MKPKEKVVFISILSVILLMSAAYFYHKTEISHDRMEIFRPIMPSSMLYNEALKYKNDGNYPKAIDFLNESAEKGYEKAQVEFGNWYFFGKVTEKDITKAGYWYHKAAENGSKEAQYMPEKYGIDSIIAVIRSEKAAKAAIIEAENRRKDSLYNMGYRYHYGVEAEKNLKEAVKCYEKAAEAGHEEAQFVLANCYFHGEGVAKDSRKAFEWYLKSAEQGNYSAEISIANCYFYGLGVEKNYEKARYWSEGNASHGIEEAEKMIRMLDSLGV